MPEGPSIVIAQEIFTVLEGQKVLEANGSSSIDFDRLSGKKIIKVESFGKHLIFTFDKFFISIHLLMFGTYRLNEQKKLRPRLRMVLKNDEASFYTCKVELIDGNYADHYDKNRDIMSPSWSSAKAKTSLRKLPDERICDVLLDQELFAGVGNIIKNESLFRARIHPLTKVGNIPAAKLTRLLKETHDYSFDFLKWKRINQLKKHFLIYKKRICPRCNIPVITEYIGKGKRLTCYCENCQKLYA